MNEGDDFQRILGAMASHQTKACQCGAWRRSGIRRHGAIALAACVARFTAIGMSSVHRRRARGESVCVSPPLKFSTRGTRPGRIRRRCQATAHAATVSRAGGIASDESGAGRSHYWLFRPAQALGSASGVASAEVTPSAPAPRARAPGEIGPVFAARRDVAGLLIGHSRRGSDRRVRVARSSSSAATQDVDPANGEPRDATAPVASRPASACRRRRES